MARSGKTLIPLLAVLLITGCSGGEARALEMSDLALRRAESEEIKGLAGEIKAAQDPGSRSCPPVDGVEQGGAAGDGACAGALSEGAVQMSQVVLKEGGSGEVEGLEIEVLKSLLKQS